MQKPSWSRCRRLPTRFWICQNPPPECAPAPFLFPSPSSYRYSLNSEILNGAGQGLFERYLSCLLTYPYVCAIIIGSSKLKSNTIKQEVSAVEKLFLFGAAAAVLFCLFV